MKSMPSTEHPLGFQVGCVCASLQIAMVPSGRKLNYFFVQKKLAAEKDCTLQVKEEFTVAIPRNNVFVHTFCFQGFFPNVKNMSSSELAMNSGIL